MARAYRQGFYKPTHPEKYKGDVNNIVYRSSWELHTNRFLDHNKKVLEWASEAIWIPYRKPTDNRIHRYYPDYWVKFKDGHNNTRIEIWEVKPLKESKKTSKVGKRKKQQLHEAVTLAVNRAKWKAAIGFCKRHNFHFRIVTEKELFR